MLRRHRRTDSPPPHLANSGSTTRSCMFCGGDWRRQCCAAARGRKLLAVVLPAGVINTAVLVWHGRSWLAVIVAASLVHFMICLCVKYSAPTPANARSIRFLDTLVFYLASIIPFSVALALHLVPDALSRLDTWAETAKNIVILSASSLTILAAIAGIWNGRFINLVRYENMWGKSWFRGICMYWRATSSEFHVYGFIRGDTVDFGRVKIGRQIAINVNGVIAETPLKVVFSRCQPLPLAHYEMKIT